MKKLKKAISQPSASAAHAVLCSLVLVIILGFYVTAETRESPPEQRMAPWWAQRNLTHPGGAHSNAACVSCSLGGAQQGPGQPTRHTPQCQQPDFDGTHLYLPSSHGGMSSQQCSSSSPAVLKPAPIREQQHPRSIRGLLALQSAGVRRGPCTAAFPFQQRAAGTASSSIQALQHARKSKGRARRQQSGSTNRPDYKRGKTQKNSSMGVRQ